MKTKVIITLMLLSMCLGEFSQFEFIFSLSILMTNFIKFPMKIYHRVADMEKL